MEYHSGGSLPLLGRPRYCPGANANGGYLCETGHCCGETGCCTYYYELWWFWLLWTVLILFSCCCAYRHRRAKQRVQQQQRQRDISLLAYHGASYTSSMLDLSFLASLKLPSYEEVAAQPTTPPPPYSSVFTAPRYPQPPRTTDPHLLTQHTHQGALQHGRIHQGALQHGPLLHQPLSDGPSSLSSDNSSSCSCDSCCPSSPCSSSLSAPITYETDTSHASTPSDATPLALDVTMETIHTAAGRLELHRDRLTLERTKSASVAIDIEEPVAKETPKLNEVTVAVVTGSVSPLETTSPNSNSSTEVSTVPQTSPTSNLSEHLEATSLLKPSKLNTDTVVVVTGSVSPLDMASPNSETTLPIGSPSSPPSPRSDMNSVLSCIRSTVAPTSPTISSQDALLRTCGTAPSPKPQRTYLPLILDSNGNSCQDKHPSLIPILAPSNLNLKTSESVEEETLIYSSRSGPGSTSPEHICDTSLTSPGERASSSTQLSSNQTNIHPTSVLSTLLTCPSQGIQNITKNPSEETESQGAAVTTPAKASTDLSHNLSLSISASELHKSNETMVTTTTEHGGTNSLRSEDTSPSEALTSPQPSDLTSRHELSQSPSRQVLNLPTPAELKMALISCSDPDHSALGSLVIPTSHDLAQQEQIKKLSNLHLSTARYDARSTFNAVTQTATLGSDVGTLSQSLPQKAELEATVGLSCPTPNSPSLLEPSHPSLVDSVSSLGLPTSPNLNLEPPLTQLASENSSSDSYPAITIHADPPSLAASPCSIPSPPGSMLLLDPLAALHPSEKSGTSSGHASSISPSPRNTQSPPKQTLFSPCVDVFEPVNPDWEDDDDEDDHDDYDDDDMGADESQYRHRRLTGDSGIEVCRCRVEDEDEEDDGAKLRKDKDGDRDGIVLEKKLGVAGTELHDSVDCPARGQKSTDTTPNPEDTGKVVIPVETL